MLEESEGRKGDTPSSPARPGLAMMLSLFGFISELDVLLSLSRFFPPPTCGHLPPACPAPST